MNAFSKAKTIISTAMQLLPNNNIPMISNAKTEAFTFGDATPITDGHDLSGYMECWFNGRWYEPQADLNGL